VRVLLRLALLLADLGLRGRSRYARLGGGAPRWSPGPLGPAAWPVLVSPPRCRARAQVPIGSIALAARRQLDCMTRTAKLQATARR
jgi:hypothetical protein